MTFDDWFNDNDVLPLKPAEDLLDYGNKCWNVSRENTLEELLKSTEVVLEINVQGLIHKELEELRG